MSIVLLLAALLCLAAIGWGVARLRAAGRGPLAGSSPTERLRAWFATLHGQRALGFGVSVAGAVLFVAILAARP